MRMIIGALVAYSTPLFCFGFLVYMSGFKKALLQGLGLILIVGVNITVTLLLFERDGSRGRKR